MIFKDEVSGAGHPLHVLGAGHLTGMVRGALAIAEREGMKREVIAERLGVGVDTLDAWVIPSRRPVTPGWALVALLLDLPEPGTLPPAARAYLVDALAGRAGMVAFEVPAGDGEPFAGEPSDQAAPETQVCEITAALGELAASLHAAREAAGPGGRELHADELVVMREKLDAVLREAGQLRESLREATQ